MSEEELQIAIQNYTPKKPDKYELGGDYYYKCHWIGCGATVSMHDNYCRKCGQKIDWEEYTK